MTVTIVAILLSQVVPVSAGPFSPAVIAIGAGVVSGAVGYGAAWATLRGEIRYSKSEAARAHDRLDKVEDIMLVRLEDKLDKVKTSVDQIVGAIGGNPRRGNRA